MKYFLAILVLLTGSAGFADELVERQSGRIESGAAFLQSNFEELERLAILYRSRESRTSSGAWYLSSYYEGIAQVGLRFEKGDQEKWLAALSKFDDWIGAYPESPTPHIALAAALMDRGWKLRGEGAGSRVARNDMDSFHDLAIQTARYLIEHEELAAVEPHWYYLLANAYRALGADKTTFWDLVSEGIDLYPDYDPILFVAGSYYSPSWYGSAEEVEKFARMALEKTQETRGYAVYARIYWVAGVGRDRTRFLFQRNSEIWKDMVRGMDDVLSRHPSQWNINHFAFFACYSQADEDAFRYMDMMEGPVVKKAWRPYLTYYDCRDRREEAASTKRS